MLNNRVINKYKSPIKLIDMPEIHNFEQYKMIMQSLLDVHDIEFKYQKKNCKRSGAAILSINHQTKLQKYTLLIDRDCMDHAKMNIFTHELMHILLDHLICKKNNQYYLPHKAREFVVDFLAESMVYTLSGLIITEYQHEYLQYQNAIDYRLNWLKSARLSESIVKMIDFQINYGIELLSEHLKEQQDERSY